jgi:hypothetical protein
LVAGRLMMAAPSVGKVVHGSGVVRDCSGELRSGRACGVIGASRSAGGARVREGGEELRGAASQLRCATTASLYSNTISHPRAAEAVGWLSVDVRTGIAWYSCRRDGGVAQGVGMMGAGAEPPRLRTPSHRDAHQFVDRWSTQEFQRHPGVLE